MWNDLWLNIVAEGLGIIVTVFIVDRLLKSNEEKRWLPAKNFIYSKLFTLINDFLVDFIPLNYWKVDLVVYNFGNTEVMVSHEINRKLINELLINDFGIAQTIRLEGSINKDEIEILFKGIQDILSNNLVLLEPELLSNVLDLENAMILLRRVLEIEKNDDILEDTPGSLLKCVATAFQIRMQLLAKVNRRISGDQFVDEHLKLVEAVQNQKRNLIRKIQEKTG